MCALSACNRVDSSDEGSRRGHGELAIDDFGTGYSSLSSLQRLRPDDLKVDKSFVTDMLTDENDAVIVRSVIELAHGLGLTVVAEGVEDSATLAMLAALHCDRAQGFHVARPMPERELTAWLNARRTQGAQGAHGAQGAQGAHEAGQAAGARP